jgi:nifR3 family TIM-barrel protein
MADVTDEAFRLIITKYGKPDVTWTEFTSADGLCDAEGKKHLKMNLMFNPKERPIVAQLFSANPEKMRKASAYVASLGFDGIDINMGCPDRKIEKTGAGAALIKNPKLAIEIINAVILGAGGIPVSVKTRIGYGKDELEKWLPVLLEAGISALTVHARTRKELSLVPANWERVKKAVQIRNDVNPDVLIIGNGDVLDLDDAEKKARETGADGVMLGRAIFGNPWLFSRTGKLDTAEEKVMIMKKLKAMVLHAKLFEKLFGKKKNFAVMKKHFKAYCSGFEDARTLRIKLMETSNAREVEKIVNEKLRLSLTKK